MGVIKLSFQVELGLVVLFHIKINEINCLMSLGPTNFLLDLVCAKPCLVLQIVIVLGGQCLLGSPF
jgi:hypothetical protein